MSKPTNLANMVSDLEPVVIECESCGVDIAELWSGKGRKPKFCDEHKSRKAAPPKSSVPAGTQGDLKTALQTLDTMYTALGVGLFAFGAHEAYEALTASIEDLQEKNAHYLANDKELVKKLSTAGKVSGRAGFFMANAMTVVPVLAIAAGEIKGRQKKIHEDALADLDTADGVDLAAA